MLYAAQHLSLACLEILVHLDKADLPADYVWSWTELQETPEILESADINRVSSCRDAGQLWATTAGQLAIRVQSAVILHELNILLNPTHAEYYSLRWSESTPFQFDPRLSDLSSSPGNDVY